MKRLAFIPLTVIALAACQDQLIQPLTDVPDLGRPLANLTSPASAPAWTEVFPTGTAPTPRSGAGYAYDEVNDRLIVFSGDDPSGAPRPNDVWVLINATGVAGAPRWEQLAPTGGPPQGHVSGTAVYDPTSNRLIVHGGCEGNCAPAIFQTWVLSNANGLGGPQTWTRLPDLQGRAFHSAAYDPASNRMMIFGGNRAFFGTNLNDVRVLTNANGLGGTPQ